MPAYTKNRLMSWSDDKELLSRVDTIGVLSQPKKKKVFRILYFFLCSLYFNINSVLRVPNYYKTRHLEFIKKKNLPHFTRNRKHIFLPIFNQWTFFSFPQFESTHPFLLMH